MTFQTTLATRICDRLVERLRIDADLSIYLKGVRPGRLQDLRGRQGLVLPEVVVVLNRWLDRPEQSDHQINLWVALLAPPDDQPEQTDWLESRALAHIERLIQESGEDIITLGETAYAFAVVDTEPQNPFLSQAPAALGLEHPAYTVFPLSVVYTAHHRHHLEELT